MQVKGELAATRLKGMMAQSFLAHSPSEAANGIRQLIEALAHLEENIMDGKHGATLSNKSLPGLDGGISAAMHIQQLLGVLSGCVQAQASAVAATSTSTEESEGTEVSTTLH